MSSISKLSSGYEILEFDELDSTMLTLKDLALSGCNIKTVVKAKRQKKGRQHQKFVGLFERYTHSAGPIYCCHSVHY